ncbi:MAG TPA: 6,7-dimethyl-8-ribityllumazine synthase, partial [candidate division Zixibacteria bacterium]|nr:6,7-dimethyl-8-ribityllumazine synthase [candidate division Zixibacteria bacterium]
MHFCELGDPGELSPSQILIRTEFSYEKIASVSFSGVNQDDITIVWVPGSFEIPGTLKLMCLSKKFDALICLGAVVKG